MKHKLAVIAIAILLTACQPPQKNQVIMSPTNFPPRVVRLETETGKAWALGDGKWELIGEPSASP